MDEMVGGTVEELSIVNFVIGGAGLKKNKAQGIEGIGRHRMPWTSEKEMD